jgi:hypothetical protein
MPGISVDGKRYPAVSTEMFGQRAAGSSEVTLVITRDDSVQMCEHDLLVEYARECLTDQRVTLSEYADQILVPHPLVERYVDARVALVRDGTTAKVVVFAKRGGLALYEWPI